jgi:hypothetical protein
MKRIAISFCVIACLLTTAHRLPAPISEVSVGQTPAPKQSASPKPKTNKPKSQKASSETATKRSTGDSTKTVVTGAAPAPAANAAGISYAAIAFSPSTGRWGYGNGYATQAEATARAIRECGQSDAKTNWCRNAWIALALSNESPGGWGSAWGVTAEAARSAATRECLARNPDAHVVVCVSAYR